MVTYDFALKNFIKMKMVYNSFYEFPLDLLIEIFGFLSYNDLLKVSEVSREFHNASNHETLWKAIYQQTFPTAPVKTRDHWKQLFASRKREQKQQRYSNMPHDLAEQFILMDSAFQVLKDQKLLNQNSTFHLPFMSCGMTYHMDMQEKTQPSIKEPFPYTATLIGSNVAAESFHKSNSESAIHTLDSECNTFLENCKVNNSHLEAHLYNNIECSSKELNYSNCPTFNKFSNITYDNFNCPAGNCYAGKNINDLDGEKFEECAYGNRMDNCDHLCSGNICTFTIVSKQNLYICNETGKCHTCSDVCCDRAFPSDQDFGFLVCPVSGRMFDCSKTAPNMDCTIFKHGGNNKRDLYKYNYSTIEYSDKSDAVTAVQQRMNIFAAQQAIQRNLWNSVKGTYFENNYSNSYDFYDKNYDESICCNSTDVYEEESDLTGDFPGFLGQCWIHGYLNAASEDFYYNKRRKKAHRNM